MGAEIGPTEGPINAKVLLENKNEIVKSLRIAIALILNRQNYCLFTLLF